MKNATTTRAELALLGPLLRLAMAKAPSFTGDALAYTASKWISVKQVAWLENDSNGAFGQRGRFSGWATIAGERISWDLCISPLNRAGTLSVTHYVHTPSDLLDGAGPDVVVTITGDEVLAATIERQDEIVERYMTPATLAPGVEEGSLVVKVALRRLLPNVSPDDMLHYIDGAIVRKVVIDKEAAHA